MCVQVQVRGDQSRTLGVAGLSLSTHPLETGCHMELEAHCW